MNKEDIKEKLFFNLPETAKIFWVLAVHAFWIFIFIVFLEIIATGYLFFKVISLPPQSLLAKDKDGAIFNYDLYEDVLNEISR
ncbi:MAG: hypothetical protein A2599_00675 [Candidatus Staskawiczbacteria bacterium RIFOXYD1_FULL_39_28]|uniref:Uncharacterized protein n=1 Tax=Candidatus Staskawiczbacteria bacterium RIFOXYC1_FULL_38_18 TaxID=1802229 RepID=A0A1G2JAW2_9BACT|nr:MAG: hypothetical protein A2401_02560 [Candidatus Staskawiczbacteria bacterium RIFOXYC1_FULL_38_18]OGZ90668.1 MAG: hypothetical protein A2599_00675 [Candidatus Staskawiczbacteria bacterium RIFOXYD1_FULL_39_28]